MTPHKITKTNTVEAYISDKRLDEFIRLFEKRFGRKPSREEALEGALKLLNLFELIYKPIAKKEFVRLLVRKFILNEDARKHIHLKNTPYKSIMKTHGNIYN
ncbi:MAG: hypothetical protein Q8R36_05370 [bacterium]|nr:hypothetical protein [bacterium]